MLLLNEIKIPWKNFYIFCASNALKKNKKIIIYIYAIRIESPSYILRYKNSQINFRFSENTRKGPVNTWRKNEKKIPNSLPARGANARISMFFWAIRFSRNDFSDIWLHSGTAYRVPDSGASCQLVIYPADGATTFLLFYFYYFNYTTFQNVPGFP